MFCLFVDPRREKVVAPIIRFKNAYKLSQSSAILLSMGEIQNFFNRYVLMKGSCVLKFTLSHIITLCFWTCYVMSLVTSYFIENVLP